MNDSFRIPAAEFSPIPFWFWNDELTEAEIKRQMTAFKEKGIDGFVIHPRLGLPPSIPYLGKRYFHFVRYAVTLAARFSMTVVLYDEGMYPSGSCHGEVVKLNPAFASQGLSLKECAPSDRFACSSTCSSAEGFAGTLPKEHARTECPTYSPKASGTSEGKCIATLEHGGKKYRLVQEPTGGTIRGVYYGEDDGEEHAPRSADLLNPDAVASFISLTHERYYEELSEHFGKTITAFFTDEPNIMGRNSRPGLIPWSDGILEEFAGAGGTLDDIYLLLAPEDTLTEKEQDQKKQARLTYNSVIHSRLSKSYYGQLAAWCSSHHVALTGHPEKSTDIGYLQHFHIPCQDIVWRFVAPDDGSALTGEHSTMAKCSADSARHHGKLRNGNECFGCCGAKNNPHLFTKHDMLWYLNWLFVRGVNMIYPHAFYYSIRGNRGDERPPEVGMHSPFWSEYKTLSDYIKRMCALNTNSVNSAEIAVLCTEDELSWQIAKPLFEHQFEFNYLETALLPACTFKDGLCQIQKQRYRILIRDRHYTPAVEQLLKAFQEKGGIVLWHDETMLQKIQHLCTPVLTTQTFSPNLRCTKLTKSSESTPEAKKHYVLLTNEGLSPLTATVSVPGATIKSVYDALTDTETLCPQSSSIDLHLPPFTSRVLFITRIVLPHCDAGCGTQFTGRE
ncbi:MAG: hypothetical protein K6G80_01765 [Treponema sp.]|nr:hypothetical protein [Treponema sp.]